MLLNGAVPYAIRSSATAMIRPDLDQAGAFCLVGLIEFCVRMLGQASASIV